jgi:hypothetical protein
MVIPRHRWQRQRPDGGKYDNDIPAKFDAFSQSYSSDTEKELPFWSTCARRQRRLFRQRSHVKVLCAIFVLSFIVTVYRSFGRTSCQNDRDSQKPQDICFVTCIFGKDLSEVDQPANVEWYTQHWCDVQFLLVTNLPTLPARGWNKTIMMNNNNDNETANFIVQSREAKFLGWKVLPHLTKQCAAVVYMDGYLQPKKGQWWWQPSTLSKFRAIADQVHHHPWGLSQVKQAYFNGLPTTTILQNLVKDRKDTVEHVNATMTWLQQQDNYQEVVTYYLNKYFAYNPRNENYQQLSTWFWKHYTTYGGLWRDQPLWAYALHHFNVTPAVMTSQGVITRGGDLFEKGGTLGWDQHVYV